MVLPDNADDIGKTVCFAKENDLDLAVKGGGHSTDYSSSTDGGISINLARLQRVHVNPTEKSVTVEGGALWEHVNRAAAQFNLAVVGGTTDQVGVGGLTLRGGNGFLTPQYGMVVDNLLSAKVVVADGRQLTASETSHPDLFWALRGAGACIGLVVEFTFKAYPQENNVWSGMVTFPGDKLASVVDVLNLVSKHPRGKAAQLGLVATSPERHDLIVSVFMFFDGTETDGRRHFAPLLDLEYSALDVSMKPYHEVPAMLSAAAPPGGRKYIEGIVLEYPMQTELIWKLADEVKRKNERDSETSNTSVQIDCIDLSAAGQVPITSTAFPSRQSIVNVALVLQWANEYEDTKMIKWAKEMKDMFHAALGKEHRVSKLVSTFIAYSQGKEWRKKLYDA